MPGGEGFCDFKKRVLSFIDEILNRFPEEIIIVVTHGGPIKIIISEILGIPPGKISRIYVKPGSINILEFYGQESYFKQLNG